MIILTSLFSFLDKKLKRRAKQPRRGYTSEDVISISHEPLVGKLQRDLEWLQDTLGDPPDLVVKQFDNQKDHLSIVYLECLVKTAVTNNLLQRLMDNKIDREDLNFGQVQVLNTRAEMVEAVLAGATVVLFAGRSEAWKVDTVSPKSRSIEDSKMEGLLRGPRDAFTESISTNLALIRKRLPDPNLRIYATNLGIRTKTKVLVLYLEDVANPDILVEIKQRFSNVEIDGILESGVLEQLVEDNTMSPFPQVQFSERPDKAVAKILAGRYLIMVDNTPFSLIVPAVFTQFLNSQEDYYERWLMASFIRAIRYVAVFLSMFLPALYIALVTWHYELIPSKLVLPVAEARTRVPFTPIMEALLMELTIEVLREAGIRLPGPIGQTIGVVGGIIVGNAAIQAGLASPLMVIVVSLTAISTFIIPNYNLGIAIRFLRFPFMILSALFGGYGMMIAWLLLVTHMVTLESFGVPYFSPISPLRWSDLKDTVFRLPTTSQIKRPMINRPQNIRRQVPKNEN